MASLIKRSNTYYIQWYEGPKKRRRSLKTSVLQIAKEKLRQFESAQFRGDTNPLPTRTPIVTVVDAYIQQMKTHRPERSWKRDLSYLREAFGECCPDLELKSNRARKCRDLRLPEDRRKKLRPLAASCFEEITTTEVSEFIAARVRARGLAPKTANRYREVVTKVFNWAMDSEFIRMPRDRNPAAKVKRYKEPAPEIRYLTLEQIDEQLEALKDHPQLQVMVEVLLYAGLRRSELLWLRTEDLLPPSAAAPNGAIQIRAKTIGHASWQPKTRSNRKIPLNSRISTVLFEHCRSKSKCDWMFTTPNGMRWNEDNFSQILALINRRHGIQWTCLDFRHTFGSLLSQNGMSIYLVSSLMGNSHTICARHYASATGFDCDSHLECLVARPNGK